ncbi:class I SAM-dependent methyltransferase [Phormidium tenue]|jgi:2-polyprenyl-3-methyl-5-hydroxy-6-metoxy-1,4-benzoquinol methylase|uniref:Methyltransferase domain-containing protein n=1 Tax=Phormidium tenue FACHB-1050 TaxID=2692857 RepID=A0ABR8C6U5_9CYAN|nr:class I SAM-dependent methyltransferase [Phormidium tenue]MBD2315391.1 methyltransferase domain-containing protein [Phormidium tenue FACHB-1050]
MINCALTGKPLLNPIYQSQGNLSVTSLSQTYEGKTVVYFNEEIGHLQTKEIENIDVYYDKQYQFFNQSDEDDILYKVVDGKKIFRQEHQVNTLLSKINFEDGMQVLDYGCAKGTVMKRLCLLNPSVETYLFDVSQMYVNLWEKFLPSDNYASYKTKKEWNKKFDVVTSFFAFEHTPDPIKELRNINNLLKDGGYFYCIVPNIFENTGDFIVADHVHHYSDVSLKYLFAKVGFETIEIDISSHFGAYIAIGKKVSQESLDLKINSIDLANVVNAAKKTANYWNTLQDKICQFEESVSGQKAAIYGAGVYGSFIATCLKNLDNVQYFIDQNPLLHGTTTFDRPIISNNDLPEYIQVVYVGLNPKIAKQVVEGFSEWQEKMSSILFL